MALNTNYGYPPSGFSSPYSSTPTGIRTQRPRFGYSFPSLYPKSHSSASTGSFSDSMINNYGTSTSQIDTTFNSENRSSFNDSYNTSGSKYYSANESFSPGQFPRDTSLLQSDLSLRSSVNLMRDSSLMYEGQSMVSGNLGLRPLACDSSYPSLLPRKPSQFNSLNYSSTFGMHNAAEFKGNFQKNSNFGESNNKVYFPKKQQKQKIMEPKAPVLRCEICSIDFTSQIPRDMHLRGAKHAKKIKTQQALTAVETQADDTIITSKDDKKTFFCELCNIKANSSLQLRMHLEGTKHKLKLQPKETSSQPEEAQVDSKESAGTSVNSKTNGSLVRPLPSDFGEPQPSKLHKFACEICNISVNSAVQLQQHLSSKKHQNKVEGKPVTKGKKIKKDNNTPTTDDTAENGSVEQTPSEISTKVVEPSEISTKVVGPSEISTKVVGVKTLASSFVHGETLQ